MQIYSDVFTWQVHVGKTTINAQIAMLELQAQLEAVCAPTGSWPGQLYVAGRNHVDHKL